MDNNKTHSAMYERLNDRYVKGYCTIKQLKKYVKLGVITEDEFNEITNTGSDE